MTLRLAEIAAEGWDDFVGSLALTGVDPRGWDLNLFLAAFEVQMIRSFHDDKERERWKRNLYDPPKDVKQAQRQTPRGGRVTVPGRAMSSSTASAIMAALAAEDARFGG